MSDTDMLSHLINVTVLLGILFPVRLRSGMNDKGPTTGKCIGSGKEICTEIVMLSHTVFGPS